MDEQSRPPRISIIFGLDLAALLGRGGARDEEAGKHAQAGEFTLSHNLCPTHGVEMVLTRAGEQIGFADFVQGVPGLRLALDRWRDEHALPDHVVASLFVDAFSWFTDQTPAPVGFDVVMPGVSPEGRYEVDLYRDGRSLPGTELVGNETEAKRLMRGWGKTYQIPWRVRRRLLKKVVANIKLYDGEV